MNKIPHIYSATGIITQTLLVEKNRQILKAIPRYGDFVGMVEGLRLLPKHLGFFAISDGKPSTMAKKGACLARRTDELRAGPSDRMYINAEVLDLLAFRSGTIAGNRFQNPASPSTPFSKKFHLSIDKSPFFI